MSQLKKNGPNELVATQKGETHVLNCLLLTDHGMELPVPNGRNSRLPTWEPQVTIARNSWFPTWEPEVSIASNCRFPRLELMLPDLETKVTYDGKELPVPRP